LTSLAAFSMLGSAFEETTMTLVHMARRIGYVIGSVTIAWLAVSLVAGILFGKASVGNPIVSIVVLVVGGLIYREIIRSEMEAA
jgi:hypothetical protein